jgi:hypothetical protein
MPAPIGDGFFGLKTFACVVMQKTRPAAGNAIPCFWSAAYSYPLSSAGTHVPGYSAPTLPAGLKYRGKNLLAIAICMVNLHVKLTDIVSSGLSHHRGIALARFYCSLEHVPTGEKEVGPIESDELVISPAGAQAHGKSDPSGRDPAWPASVQVQPHFFRPIAISVVGGVYSAWVNHPALILIIHLPHSCGCRRPPGNAYHAASYW